MINLARDKVKSNSFEPANLGVSSVHCVITNQTKPNGFKISEYWFDGYKQFNFTTYKCYNSHNLNTRCYQFAQIMWVNTKRMGCACTPLTPGQKMPYRVVVTCLYEPAGNTPGGYIDNIPLMYMDYDKPHN